MWYETLWIGEKVGAAATPRGGASGAGIGPAGSRAPRPGFGFIGAPMAGGLAQKGGGGIGSQANPGPPNELDDQAAGEVVGGLAGRRRGLRVSHRTLDPEADGGRDSARIRGALPPLARLEDSARLRVELPSARTAGAPTG